MRLTIYLPGLTRAPVPGPPGELLAGLALPAIERLLARAEPVSGPGAAPEAGLFELVGCAPGEGGPAVAAVARLAERPAMDPAAGWWLRADPVHLRPDLSKVILIDATVFGLDEGEAQALAAAVAPLFDEAGGALEVAAPERWYLRFAGPLGLVAAPLSAVVGQDLRAHLPVGPDARRLRALLTEVEMTLFAHPVNQAREARGLVPVNGLWLWGGGHLPSAPATRWRRVYGDDALARGLARLAGSEHRALPRAAGEWLAGAGAGGELVVVDRLWRAARYGDLEAWRDGLDWLESEWVAPLLAALARAEFAELTLLDGAGAGWRLSRRGLWRWWRRPRGLAQRLAPAAGG